MSAVVNRGVTTKAGVPATRAGLPFSYGSIGSLLMAADLLTIPLASLATGSLYHRMILGSHGDTGVFLGTGILVSYLFVSVLYPRGAYRPSKIVGSAISYQNLAWTWLGVFLSLAGVAFILHVSQAFSRGAVLSFFVVGFAGVVGVRIGIGTLARRAIKEGRLKGARVVFIGHLGAAAGTDHVQELRRYGYRVAHSIMLPPAYDEDAARSIVEQVVNLAKTDQIEEIVLALQWSELRAIDQIAVGLRRLPIPVRLLPDGIVRHLIHLPSSDLGASMALELHRGPLSAYERTLKRALDIVVASLGLVAISPLLLLVMALIKLESPGPVFFRQLRTGYSGRTFRIFKFRTMRVLEDGEVITQARKDDDRVTRLGRWLRRTSIDELPQLINVLLGNMSLVGPRPHALAHDVEYDRLIGDYGLRFQVKPGITGWAQVNGYRGQTETVDLMMSRVECDLWYINNWSLLLDITTLLKTFGAQLRANNAY